MERLLRQPIGSPQVRQLLRWMWYEQVEPFGELRADYRAAQVVAMVRNVAVTPEHQKTVEECLLKFSGPRKKQSVDEQILALNIMAHAFSVPGVDD